MKFQGTVVGGSRRAASLGYPTANIAFNEDLSGIFVATVLVEEKAYPALAFADPDRKLLEAHLFNFVGDLYGKTLVIEVLEKLRESERFVDEESLQRAIDEDAKRARAYHGI